MRISIFKFIYIVFLVAAALSFAQDGAPVSKQGSISSARPLSAISSEIDVESDGLQRYGYNLFQQDGFVREMTGGALSDDYRLGPGDQLGVFLGGKTQENFTLTVSVDGKLYVPTLGVLFVSGLTLDEFRDELDRALHAYYSDYSLNIILTAPKSVSVSVVGEVRAPGNYSGSALGSVLDFISKARGVALNGSFRNIQVFRKDSLVARIDLYDYLMRPRSHQSFSLQSGDIIFVPVLASTISVEGEVNREAIYELNPISPICTRLN